MDMRSDKGRSNIAQFFRTEYERLVRYVRTLIDDAAERDGEDIVQDVILGIFNVADVSTPIENLSAYIYQSLRHRVVDYLRKRRTDLVSLEDETFNGSDLSLSNLLRDSRHDTSHELEKKEMLQCLFAAIESLSDDQKAIFIETEFEGRSFSELSSAWGVPIGTLLARKSRALNRIKKALADFNS